MKSKNIIYSDKALDNSKIVNFIKNKSLELGIDIIGFGSIDEFEKLNKKFYKNSKYSNPKDIFLKSKTIISAGLSYNYDWNNISNESIGYIAKYTSANFYKILSKKLKELGKSIKKYLDYNIPDKDFFRVYVNSKINDKLSAYICGLGYFAKNTLIFVKDKGCKYILGELLLPFEFIPSEKLNSNCGKCNLCIDACPTKALTDNGRLKRKLCIQHLSSEYDWPEKINNKSFIKIWGVRFFGCTNCIDICPFNKSSHKIDYKEEELIGFIGTTFDVMNVLKFNKNDYKTFFKRNQLSANWIPTATLARNCLASLYNLDRKEIIEEYIKKLDNYDWNDLEKKFLKKFCFFLLNSKGN
jgi:epoxyqueuosine reductase